MQAGPGQRSVLPRPCPPRFLPEEATGPRRFLERQERRGDLEGQGGRQSLSEGAIGHFDPDAVEARQVAPSDPLTCRGASVHPT